MTKEQILETKNWSSEYPNFMAESEVFDAMDEYARSLSIGFAEFILKDYDMDYFDDGRENDLCCSKGENNKYTIEQLYSLFINQVK